MSLEGGRSSEPRNSGQYTTSLLPQCGTTPDHVHQQSETTVKTSPAVLSGCSSLYSNIGEGVEFIHCMPL